MDGIAKLPVCVGSEIIIASKKGAWAMTAVETGSWYSEATLILDDRLLRAGTLIQCARRWQNLASDEKQRALVRLTTALDGETILRGEGIGALALRPGFRFA